MSTNFSMAVLPLQNMSGDPEQKYFMIATAKAPGDAPSSTNVNSNTNALRSELRLRLFVGPSESLGTLLLMACLAGWRV